MIYIAILLTILIISLLLETRNLGYKCGSYYNFIPSKESSIAENISKIHSLSRYMYNSNYVPRYFIIAMVIAMLICIYNLDINEKGLFYTTFVAFFVILFSANFYQYHHDRFPLYYIQKNARNLSQQLSTKIKKDVKQAKQEKPITHVDINAYDALYNSSVAMRSYG